jgi:molecular chaperone GrpE
MKSIFTSKGLKEIISIGEDFNTDFHEAITSIPAPTEEMKNKVVDEIQKGYLLHDKVIRFSKVITGS